jgi:anti-anti-sigma factor
MPTRPLGPYHRAKVTARVADEVLRESSVDHRLVRRAIDAGAYAVHLDLGAVHMPTAGGLGQLVALHCELRAAGVTLVLCNVNRPAYEVFEVTGLARLLDLRLAFAT